MPFQTQLFASLMVQKSVIESGSPIPLATKSFPIAIAPPPQSYEPNFMRSFSSWHNSSSPNSPVSHLLDCLSFPIHPDSRCQCPLHSSPRNTNSYYAYHSPIHLSYHIICLSSQSQRNSKQWKRWFLRQSRHHPPLHQFPNPPYEIRSRTLHPSPNYESMGRPLAKASHL